MERPENLEHLRRVCDYYEETTSLYLDHVGSTFQAGLLKVGRGKNRARESTLLLASRAGLRDGDRVLDAGCGVCGPAMDLASEYPGVDITGLTLSPTQATLGNQMIRERNLHHRVRAMVGDFHHLPFQDGEFGQVFFFESLGYAHDPGVPLKEAHRVLKPGGRVYIKDLYIPDGRLSPEIDAERESFNQLYHYNLATFENTLAATRNAGFQKVKGSTISDLITVDHFVHCMYDWRLGVPLLNPFGKRHHLELSHLQTVWGDIVGEKV